MNSRRSRTRAACLLPPSRARIILGLAGGKSYRSLHERPQTSAASLARWRHRFEQEGLTGLVAVHPGRPPSKLTPALRAKVLAKTAERPPDCSIHGSCRKLPGCWG